MALPSQRLGNLYSHFVPASTRNQAISSENSSIRKEEVPHNNGSSPSECSPVRTSRPKMSLANSNHLNQSIHNEESEPLSNTFCSPYAVVANHNIAAKNLDSSSMAQSYITLDGRVSHNGFESDSDLEEKDCTFNPKEIIRANQGTDARQLFLDWDGKTWMPPPVDWENDRGSFDPSFLPYYCQEWVSQIPTYCALDMTTDGFILGTHPVTNTMLGTSITQPETIPGKTPLTYRVHFYIMINCTPFD